MAANKAKPKVALGNNPLSQGIFSKTVESAVSADTDETVEVASIVETESQEPKLPPASANNLESRFLIVHCCNGDSQSGNSCCVIQNDSYSPSSRDRS